MKRKYNSKNANKTDILLSEKEIKLNETINEYKKLIAEAKALKKKYYDALKEVNELKEKYQKEMAAQLRRIKSQK